MNSSTGPTHKPGPAIHLPGYMSQLGALSVVHRKGGAIQSVGYTAEHAAYPIV